MNSKKIADLSGAILMGAVLLASTKVMATGEDANQLGVDFAIPTSVSIENSADDVQRDNVRFTVYGKHHMSEFTALGLRASFDLEDNNAASSAEKIQLTPTVSRWWMVNDMLHPFVQGEMPVTVRGALNPTGDSGQADLGIGAATGVAWHISEPQNGHSLALQASTALGYQFGIGSALQTLVWDVARAGLEYQF